MIIGKDIAQAIRVAIKKYFDMYATKCYVASITGWGWDGVSYNITMAGQAFQSVPTLLTTFNPGDSVFVIKGHGVPLMIVGKIHGNTQQNLSDFTIGG